MVAYCKIGPCKLPFDVGPEPALELHRVYVYQAGQGVGVGRILLAWAIERLGDPFAIAGFHSNTRHEVRYQHILGFSERWGEASKGRLAAVQAGYSTRMGAAMRHAAHYLGAQKVDKKLLLVLTDGEPADVDVSDPQALILDTRQAVKELTQQGIHSHCISLDPNADAYVRDIFGHHFTVVDRVEQLPERLPRLFMALTR